jgi:hypothetical protein
MEEELSRGEGGAPCERGDVVWAKILGWPWWPAVVVDTPTCVGQPYRVDFL